MELLRAFLIALVITGGFFIFSCAVNFFKEKFPEATEIVLLLILVILITLVIYLR